MKRKGKISRKTKETSISVDLNIDGKGKYKIDTGIGFLNHMLEQLSKHSSYASYRTHSHRPHNHKTAPLASSFLINSTFAKKFPTNIKSI